LQIGYLDVACLERRFRSNPLVLAVGSVEGVVSDKQENTVSKRKHKSFFCVFSFSPSTAHLISKERGLRGGFGQPSPVFFYFSGWLVVSFTAGAFVSTGDRLPLGLSRIVLASFIAGAFEPPHRGEVDHSF